MSMKYSIQLFGLIGLIVISSCNYGPKRSKTIPVIDIEANVDNMQKIYLSQFSDKILYIPMESKVDHLLMWNTHLYADFSENYIIDSDGQICLLYDKNGHFIKQIGSQGRGPGEYTGIKYVKLLGNKILVYDYISDDLIEYRIDGSFEKRYRSGLTGNNKYRLMKCFFLDDSLILGNIENFTGRDEFKAMIINKSGSIKKFYKNYIYFTLEPGMPYAQSPGEASYYRFRDKVFFKEYLNDTLFQLDANYNMTPYIIFRFGKHKMPLSDRGKPWSKIDFGSYISLGKIFETNNYLFLVCGSKKYFPVKRLTPEIIRLPGLDDYIQWYNSGGVIGVYDKNSKKLVFSAPSITDNHLSGTGLYNDIDGGPKFQLHGMLNDSTMVMKIRFDYLVEYIESDEFNKNMPKYPDKKRKLHELVNSLQMSGFDNPVYMFVTFKK